MLVAALAVPLASYAQVRPPPAGQQPQQRQRPEPEDTIPVPPFRYEPPVSPLGALGRSMLIPGWGQAVLGRRGAGAFFVFWEGLALTMTVKSAHQLSYQESIDAETVESKREELQDWIVLLAFNHLVAGVEAFVAANLWDFPAELEGRALPGGGSGLGLRVHVGGRRGGGR